MSFTDSLLLKELEATRRQIAKDELRNRPVSVRSIQLLLPDTYQLRNIQRLLYCAKKDESSYKRLTSRFVYGSENPNEGSEVLRSLYFLSFRPPFMYASYGQARDRKTRPRLVLAEGQHKRRDNRVEVPESLEKKLKKKENLNPFWDEWVRTLNSSTFGDSTLWTYVMIREDSGLPAISSAYVVFDGLFENPACTSHVDFESLTVISKRLQDCLVRLIGKLYIGALAHRSTSAAISQVMARNMSHNINSHVSYKATNPNVKKRILELYGYDVK